MKNWYKKVNVRRSQLCFIVVNNTIISKEYTIIQLLVATR